MGEEKEIGEAWGVGRESPEPVHTTMRPPPEGDPPEITASFAVFVHDPFGPQASFPEPVMSGSNLGFKRSAYLVCRGMFRS